MTQTQTEIVTIRIEDGEEMFHATSPTMRGLLVSKHNLNDLLEEIPKAITDINRVKGKEVVVIPANGESFYRFVVIHKAELKKLLEGLEK